MRAASSAWKTSKSSASSSVALSSAVALCCTASTWAVIAAASSRVSQALARPFSAFVSSAWASVTLSMSSCPLGRAGTASTAGLSPSAFWAGISSTAGRSAYRVLVPALSGSTVSSTAVSPSDAASWVVLAVLLARAAASVAVAQRRAVSAL
ncbi:hypothetical protein D3226_05880 [Leucobacter chromiireducens subsp. chromiireducens]|uniref:Secreted protein n=1 Tax=Leucobacter chromiireducens subsp. chromiireducens TaxID=660067 RepID=A0ABS1SMT9_9MICO|nr:hypothetical protein [Leucobacter chromiireducens subsp. chromiireducens]